MQKRKIKCDYEGCGRTYCSYFNLKRHIESSHLGVRKFKCETCGRYLSSKQNYIDHHNIHTGAKPYCCEYPDCSLRFRQLSQYYLHKQLHSDIPNQPVFVHPSEDSIISFLGKKLAQEEKRIYSIPLLPYSLDQLDLPQIKVSSNYKITASPLLEFN